MTILQGNHDKPTGLWLVPITDSVLTSRRTNMHLSRKQRPHTIRTNQQLHRKVPHRANSAYHQRTLPNLAAYLHACTGFVPPATLIRAINKGWFTSWPGLTASLISKHLPKSIPSTMGHLHMTRKNVRSTKARSEPAVGVTTIKGDPYDEQALPHRTTDASKTHHVGIARVLPIDQMAGTVSTDITGRFPITSARGNAYVFVMYDYDSNAILASPIKDRTK